MRYKELEISINRQAQEALTPIMEAVGVEGCTIKDEGTTVTCLLYLPYFPGWERKWEIIKERVKSLPLFGLEINPCSFTERMVDSNRWQASSQPNAEPREIYPDIWIVPPAYKLAERLADGYIRLHTGPAFGTGFHPTTRLAIGLIKDYFTGLAAILDIGTGSGVLSLVATSEGVQNIVAIERDPAAVVTARENVRINGLESVINVVEGDFNRIKDGNFQGIVINILLEQALMVLPRLCQLTVPPAFVIVSGLLYRQLDCFKEELTKTEFVIAETRVKDEWVALLLRPGGK